jgi:hypothetical protein
MCLIVAGVGLFWPGLGQPSAEPGWLARRLYEVDPQLIDASKRKTALKDEVFDDLIAGRQTLADAVVRIQEIEAQFPEFAPLFRQQVELVFPGSSFEESLARNIVSHCRHRVQTKPDRAGPVVARLETELAAIVQP